MDRAEVAARKPVLVELKAGKTYFWCSCGRSQRQPFCDGSHADTAFAPLKFTGPSDGDFVLCACKQTASPPYCDGSHNSLDDAYELAGVKEIEATRHLPVTPRTSGQTGRALLDGGCFVVTPDPDEFSRHGNVRFARLIGADAGARFVSLFYLIADHQQSRPAAFPEASAALFVLKGFGAIDLAGRRLRIEQEQGVLVCPGEPFELLPDAGSGPLTVTATVCPQSDKLAPAMPAPAAFDERFGERVFPVDDSQRQPMADRFYQVLIDHSVAPADMTQFVGEVPPSRAAFHRHLYEETITILSGEGYLWTHSSRAAVKPGDAIFLPRSQPHSLECTSAEGMRLVGAFYPAGSPAINY